MPILNFGSATMKLLLLVTLVSGPKHGDAVVCENASLVVCSKSYVLVTIPGPTGQAAIYAKSGSVDGKYTVSYTVIVRGQPISLNQSTMYMDFYVKAGVAKPDNTSNRTKK